MPLNPIVIGLVGAGFAASFHIENYRRVPGLDIRIKGGTSRKPESATAFSRKHRLEQTMTIKSISSVSSHAPRVDA